MLVKIKNKIISMIGKRKNKVLETQWRSRLKNDNFSIICSSCIRGVIYNRLGKKFLSPTINLYFTQGDFIKFACDLPYYISQNLNFVESEEDFPVAMLDDITVYFNHAKSANEAMEDWNRRKDRINYNNIYIILYYRDNYTIDEIRKIEQAHCKRKIILTSKKLDLDYAYYMEENINQPNSEVFLDKDKYGIRTFEKKWDFISWLNGTDD